MAKTITLKGEAAGAFITAWKGADNAIKGRICGGCIHWKKPQGPGAGTCTQARSGMDDAYESDSCAWWKGEE